MKLAIVVGHNSVAQGAVRADTAQTEFAWNTQLARRIELLAAREGGAEVRTFFRTKGGGYRAELARAYAEVDAWGADASIELHFNGAASPDATGTETLSSGSALSLRLATHVQGQMVAALGLRDRGIRTRARSERGGGSLYAGAAPAILVEPFFGSSPKGQQATDDDAEQLRLARAILDGALAAYRTFPRATLQESRTLKAAKSQRGMQATAAVSAAVAEAGTLAKDQLQDIPVLGGLTNYLPWIVAGLIGLVFIATVVQRALTDKIEEARVDDHERGAR